MDNNKNKTVPVKEKIHLVVENSDTKKSQEVELEDMTLSMENSSNGPLLKFYDKDHKLIAINQNDGRGFLPSSRYADILSLKENKQVLEFFQAFSNATLSDISKMSQTLGIPREKILSITEAHNSKPKEEEEKVHIQEKNEINKAPAQTHENKIMAKEKQQTPLSQKVDERHTLGDILGVPDDGTLVAVYSTDIENGTQENHTRFSFLIRDKDGNYKECPNLEQIGGVTPSSQIASSKTYDGSRVEQEQVNSLYRVKGSGNIEHIISAKIGPQGSIELGIGQRDRTEGLSNPQTVTQPLKTSSFLYTTREVREAINSTYDGVYQGRDRNDEAFSHTEKCKIGLDEVDGDTRTGHTHEDETNGKSKESPNEIITKVASNILEDNEDIANVYTFHEVVDRLIKNYHNGISEEELESKVEEELSIEASHIPTREH